VKVTPTTQPKQPNQKKSDWDQWIDDDEEEKPKDTTKKNPQKEKGWDKWDEEW